MQQVIHVSRFLERYAPMLHVSVQDTSSRRTYPADNCKIVQRARVSEQTLSSVGVPMSTRRHDCRVIEDIRENAQRTVPVVRLTSCHPSTGGFVDNDPTCTCSRGKTPRRAAQASVRICRWVRAPPSAPFAGLVGIIHGDGA